jgi:hypothetical protein
MAVKTTQWRVMRPGFAWQTACRLKRPVCAFAAKNIFAAAVM